MKMSVSSKHWPSCYEVWMGNHIGHTMSVSQLHLWTWLWFPPLWYHSDNNCVQSDACLNFQDNLWENHFLDKNLLFSTSNFYLKIQLGRKGNRKGFLWVFCYFSKMKHEMELNMADAEQVTCVRIEPENPSLLCLVFAFTTIDYWVTNQYNGGSFLIP